MYFDYIEPHPNSSQTHTHLSAHPIVYSLFKDITAKLKKKKKTEFNLCCLKAPRCEVICGNMIEVTL